ncbi:MAG: type II toxin-antitoxin system VapC family toxin [Lachnospiraceae bacterium]|nr:type II toxin-antitoxin system VapC family toxin [Lachnospiraceae bacterium]
MRGKERRKLRVYLDTSVISHLDATDTPDKMLDTTYLWDEIKAGKFEVCVSGLTMIEIERCPEPKRTTLLEYLSDIKFVEIHQNEEALTLSAMYFDSGGLPPKSKDDALHIAIASVNDCDVVVSWNFKHIVNLRAIEAVEKTNFAMRYKNIRILSPSMLLEKED